MGKRKKKKSKPFLLLILIIAALVGYIAVVVEHQLEERRQAHFALYPAFGISIPTGYEIHGIDVSTHQEFIDWGLVGQMRVKNVRIGFAFIKATEGLEGTDKQFERNWEMAKASGVARGAYHFFIATKSGVLQAQHFISTVKLEKGDLPPVVDIEELYGEPVDSMRASLQAYLQTIEAAYKVKPIIYCYADFYESYLGKTFDEYPLWVAHYNVERAQADGDKKVARRNWIFWQHSEEGHVDGIVPKVDFDVFEGDSTDLSEIRMK